MYPMILLDDAICTGFMPPLYLYRQAVMPCGIPAGVGDVQLRQEGCIYR